jgi:hypothetical protein
MRLSKCLKKASSQGPDIQVLTDPTPAKEAKTSNPAILQACEALDLHCQGLIEEIEDIQAGSKGIEARYAGLLLWLLLGSSVGSFVLIWRLEKLRSRLFFSNLNHASSNVWNRST